MIELLATGLIYHSKKMGRQTPIARHPTLVAGEREMLAIFDLFTEQDPDSYRTYISRSENQGESWDDPTPLLPNALIQDPVRPSTHVARPERMSNGQLVAVVGRSFRDGDGDEKMVRQHMGRNDMDLHLAVSNDDGRNWKELRPIVPPLDCPTWEVAHAPIELKDGRWLLPLVTWRTLQGEAPHGIKAVAFVSTDQGKTWPSYIDILDDYANDVIHWEQSVIQLHDEDHRLLAIAWAFNEQLGKTTSVNYAVSHDGQTFSHPPRVTGLKAETSKLLALPDGRAICAYRSIDPGGLCASVVHLQNDQWHHSDPVVLWQGVKISMMSGDKEALDELEAIKFGYPNLLLLPNGDVMVAFWCLEDDLFNIRWVRLSITD